MGITPWSVWKRHNPTKAAATFTHIVTEHQFTKTATATSRSFAVKQVTETDTGYRIDTAETGSDPDADEITFDFEVDAQGGSANEIQ